MEGTMKLCGLTSAALLCLSLAQPARAAADCPAYLETTVTDPSGSIAQPSLPAAEGAPAGLPLHRVTGAADAAEPYVPPSGCFEIGWPFYVYCCCEFGVCACMPTGPLPLQ